MIFTKKQTEKKCGSDLTSVNTDIYSMDPPPTAGSSHCMDRNMVENYLQGKPLMTSSQTSFKPHHQVAASSSGAGSGVAPGGRLGKLLTGLEANAIFLFAYCIKNHYRETRTPSGVPR